MKKYKLVRMAALSVAAVTTVALVPYLSKKGNDNIFNGKEITDIDCITAYRLVNYKYNIILAQDSLYKYNLTRVADDIGSLIGSCYSLPSGYHLYTPYIENQGYAVPSITLNDGTQIFALSNEEALSCVGVTEEAYQMLAVIDEYERQLDTTDKMSR